MSIADRLRRALRDRYRIEHELGRGGMAVVYLARDLKHDRPVAIKVLRPEVSAALGSERFLLEIQIAAKLQHPHIVPLYDSGEADGLLYFVMPYLEGETLGERLRREPQLPLEEALGIASEIAEALSLAHSVGVIHRDIKPENVWLSGGHALVLDFGVARALREAGGASLTSSGIAIGTPAYMSPEQGAGSGELDARSDIYSLGCTLFEMLAGEPPFTGATAQAVVARHVSQDPPSIRVVRGSVSEALERVVEKALAKSPADRYQTAASFAEALGEIMRPAPPARRVPTLVLWTVLVVVGISAGLIALLVVRDDGSVTLEGEVELDPTHVAVLYFDDNTEEQRLLHVANGLTESLIDELRRVPDLTVSSPNAVRAYSRRGVPLDSIAKTLGAGTLVEGSVAQSGGLLRVTARLVDGTTALQQDSRTLQRPFGELFALQDQLATEVARFLRRQLGIVVALRERRRGTHSVAAWEMVRLAESRMRDAEVMQLEGDPGAAMRFLSEADSLLTLAEARDPEWLEPVALRGWVANERADVAGPEPGSVDDRWLEVALQHVERGIRMRPADPQMLELRGTVTYRRWLYGSVPRTESQLERSERDLRTATLEGYPWRARALSTLSRLLQVQGRFAEANHAARRAYEADAFLRETPEILFRLYLTSMDLQRTEEAVAWCQEGHRRFPREWQFAFCELTILVWPGDTEPDIDRAWALVGELGELVGAEIAQAWRPRWEMMVAGVIARAGLADSAHAVMGRAREAGGADPEVAHHEAAARLLLGERDSALTLLATYLEQNPQLRRYIALNPVFRTLEDSPRFRELVGRAAGVPPPGEDTRPDR